jgi:hypothetical protein
MRTDYKNDLEIYAEGFRHYLMHVGSSGITGNMYSRGYRNVTNAITLIDNAL